MIVGFAGHGHEGVAGVQGDQFPRVTGRAVNSVVQGDGFWGFKGVSCVGGDSDFDAWRCGKYGRLDEAAR